jgi:GntR family transcriptional regulator
VIAFRLDERSGVPTYLQLVEQVRGAVRYGVLHPGDQLPTARDVVARLAINPNTVLKAYRELERDGVVRSFPGRGTFVTPDAPRPIARAVHEPLRRALRRWIADARRAGLDREAIADLLGLALRDAFEEEIA